MADAPPPAPPADAADGAPKEKFYDPVTGEEISKNAWKKLQKAPKKEKKEKPAAPAGGGEKKEKKEKPKKEPEQIFVDETPVGQKKKLEGIFPTSYQPKYVESAWQSWWEENGYYAPDVAKAAKLEQKDKFVMVIPPPNVTGSLHLGHALTNAIEDTLTRWNRMKGKVTLWVPGTDHAGIATQSVVEKRLKKEHNITRHELGREEFTKRVWDWKNTYGNKITKQIRSLGASVDWGRESFTMDANLSRAVTEAFCRFHESGLLYRDTRLINWSCALQSAISEIEVDYIDVEDRTFLPVPNHKNQEKYEFGMITSFAYKVADSPTGEEIVVATTRLETMLGDTGVAVHPQDPRYTHLHGKMLKHPFVDRLIPIITDSTLVDMSFGTGAVKVTPAHDPNDYLCGKRNDLEFIIVLTGDGKIADNGGKYAGMMRYDARVAMENEMKELDLYRGKEVNKMRLGLCSRSGDIIEPMLTPQWYVNCDSMAQRSIDAVRNGDLKIVPDMHEATWFRWLENIRDWCVSRQLWWGHRIPAYFVYLATDPTKLDKNDPENSGRWFVARTAEDARRDAAAKLGAPESDVTLEQDEDVLDTWFSSGLFPFSVFGWPNNTEDLDAFYPTSLLETGADILFFWVARMVMMGLQLTDKLPFTTVYLHAMVRDQYGRKMSKSLGNVVDPLEVINGCQLEDLLKKIDEGNLPAKEVEKAKNGQRGDFPDGIPECGADALRFGLLAYTSQGRDINLDIKRVVGYRQFCNKMWNAVKFGMQYLSDLAVSPSMHLDVVSDPSVSKRDLYILSRLNLCITESNQHLSEYNFGAVASTLHSFFLYDLCDVYLELIKPIVTDTSEENKGRRRCAQIALYTCLEQYLRLCHPLMPFVTEELWQRMPSREAMCSDPSIMIAAYPEPIASYDNPAAEASMDVVKKAIAGARSLRADYKIANHVKADFYFRSDFEDVREALSEQGIDVCTLSKGNFLQYLEKEQEAPKGCTVKILNERCSLLVNLTGIIDIAQEIQRMNKEIDRIVPSIEQYKKKMQAPGYDKVPEKVRETNTVKVASLEAELAAIREAVTQFESMRL